jgi:predicted Zn-dependent protease with MMP-like domain
MSDDKLEEAWDLLADERYEEVLETLEDVDDPEASFLRATALYELGELSDALEHCAEALTEEEWAEPYRLRAAILMSSAEPEEALEASRRAVELEPESADAHHTLGLVFTQLGRIAEADASFSRASELAPDEYFVPFRLQDDAFDDAIEEALSNLPSEFREQLENVEIAIEDIPSRDLIQDGSDYGDLGLYYGSTIQAEEAGLPDRILLFQRNLENISPDRETLIAEIGETLLHEVGHHMGLEEEDLEEGED